MRSEPVSSPSAPGGSSSPAPAPRRGDPPAARSVDSEREVGRAQVEEAMRDANRALVRKGAQLTFELDDRTDRVIVRLVDTTTNEVLRQIPTKEALAIAQALSVEGSVAGLIRASA